MGVDHIKSASTIRETGTPDSTVFVVGVDCGDNNQAITSLGHPEGQRRSAIVPRQESYEAAVAPQLNSTKVSSTVLVEQTFIEALGESGVPEGKRSWDVDLLGWDKCCVHVPDNSPFFFSVSVAG